MATIKKAQSGEKVDAKKYLEESKKRVKKIVTPLRKAEIKKGIITYDDYLNSQIKNKNKMKNGGSLSSLDASTKRDKGIDPKGAYTTVQKKTLAGAKGKASLTKDKQLGATKMAKRGMKISKKK